MNTFGRFFKLSIFGESHGDCVGITLDGCPPGIELSELDFECDLTRRKGLNIKGTTPRKEEDSFEVLSGIFNGKTTGTPLTLIFKNKDVRSSDYSPDIPRPGHADFVAFKKFNGFQDYRGGGHFSGRLTAPLVAAGVIAKKIISPVNVTAIVTEVGGSTKINEVIEETLSLGDSIGGIVECVVSGLPIGIGEPFFDSLESLIAHAVFSIPAIKGIEFGKGFEASRMKGSEFNDPILDESGRTSTNNAGGINGGISNGNDIVFRVAVKPPSSIKKEQKTLSLKSGEISTLKIDGRHDACLALRVPPVLEAVTACVLADLVSMVPGNLPWFPAPAPR